VLDLKQKPRESIRVESVDESQGKRVSASRLERPTLRDFPARSNYNIITLIPWGNYLHLAKIAIVTLVFLPTIFAVIYFGLIVTPRYEAEAKFVVRTAAKAASLTGLTSILHITGLARSQDDAYSVQDFMTSRDAVAQLMDKLPLEQMYGRRVADFVARYPSILFGPSREEFYKYFQWMISVSNSSTSGISTLRVQAFRAEDAVAVAQKLLDLSEALVNRLNERIHEDAVKVSAAQVQSDERRLTEAELAITDFRNRELMIDPEKSSVVLSEVMKRLSANLAATQTNMYETSANSPSSPQLTPLQNRADAINTQIEQERARISNSSDGLANKIGEFERLNLERDYAKQALTASTTTLEAARAEARRKQLYLERIVEPSLPDYAAMPQSLRWIMSIFGANLLGLLIVWLFVTGIREHLGAQL
jgi:capsular polysaccharide transport system permease protein